MLLLCHIHTRSIAAGLYAIADYVDRGGEEIELLHDPLERELDPHFDLAAYAETRQPLAVGFSLHWAHQTAETLDRARAVRKRLPGVHITMGGLTASTFGKQILETYDFIDSVVLGDGEEPTLQLMRALKAGGGAALAAVPNLVYRDGGEIKSNPRTYGVTKEIMEALNYGRHDLMRHGTDYAKGVSNLRVPFFGETIHFQPTGKGCAFQCTFCGGSHEAQMLTTARKSVRYRAVDGIVKEMEEQVARGCRTFMYCFDPAPDGKFYPELFEEVRRRIDGPLQAGFSSWRLPGERIQEALAKTFRRSYVELSPEVADEDLRVVVKGKGASFTNPELEAALDGLVKRNIGVELYFSYFHSGEPVWETAGSIDLIQHLTARYGRRINPLFLALSTDPAATRTIFQPEGVELLVRTIAEYETASAKPDFRSNIMAYRPTCLSMAEFDEFSLAIEMFNRLQSALPTLGRAIHLARGGEGMLALLRQGARAALKSGLTPDQCVAAGLKAILDPKAIDDVAPELVAMGRLIGEPGDTSMSAAYTTSAGTRRDHSAGTRRSLDPIRVPARYLDYLAKPENLNEARPPRQGPEVDVLDLRAGQSVAYITMTPAVRQLLDRCLSGVYDRNQILASVPLQHRGTARQLVDLFTANGLANFTDMARPPMGVAAH